MRVEPEIDETGDAPATGLGTAVISARSRSRRRAETMGAAGSANTSAPRRTTGQSASGARADDAADRAHAGLGAAAGAVNSSGVSRNAARALDTSSLARRWVNTAANAPPATFRVLQEWEGYVVDVGTGEFTACLIDLTAGESHEREEAAIPMAVISEGDVNLAVSGGVFRWLVGHEHSSKGLRRVSRIVFRRFGALTQADIDGGKAWAREITRSVGNRCRERMTPDKLTFSLSGEAPDSGSPEERPTRGILAAMTHRASHDTILRDYSYFEKISFTPAHPDGTSRPELEASRQLALTRVGDDHLPSAHASCTEAHLFLVTGARNYRQNAQRAFADVDDTLGGNYFLRRPVHSSRAAQRRQMSDTSAASKPRSIRSRRHTAEHWQHDLKYPCWTACGIQPIIRRS